MEQSEGFIQELFGHHLWANLALLSACEGLSDDQLDTQITGTFGSIRRTLTHIVGSEASYVHRVTGEIPGERPENWGQLSLEELRRYAEWSGPELLKLALRATPADIIRQTRDKATRSYPLDGLLVQAINHATEHRAQVAATLTHLGIEPPDMSGWAYMHARDQLEVNTDGD